MKHVGGCFLKLLITLLLGAIGLGAWFLLKWGWSESPLITVISVVVALGFMAFGVAHMTGKRDFGTLGMIAGVTAAVAAASAMVLIENGGPLLS
ncbi:hypothetical protein LFM09_42095 [Lentzea alba]|uniref:hypothetical protein n=1 Tax=Lentzea alba TaxID=2714351 RepID=UPI0039BFBAD3